MQDRFHDTLKIAQIACHETSFLKKLTMCITVITFSLCACPLYITSDIPGYS